MIGWIVLPWLVAGCLTAASAPPAAGVPVERVAFGSGLDQDRPAPVLDAILAFGPDTFVFLGDNVRAGGADMQRLARAYETLGSSPGYQRLRERSRIFAVWDDQDLGEPGASAGYPHLEAARQLMLDFFGEPADSPRRQGEGNYGALTLGPPGRRVQFVLLDTRWFRTPVKIDEEDRRIPAEGPEAALLGEAQWGWLEEVLTEPAEIRVVCTSTQVLNTLHPDEKWADWPEERRRLLALVRRHAGDVLVLSGGRLHGEMSIDHFTSAGRENVLVETTVGGFNEARARQGDRDEPSDFRAGDIHYEPNFGTLEIDWRQRIVTVSIRNERGGALKQVQLRMQEDPEAE